MRDLLDADRRARDSTSSSSEQRPSPASSSYSSGNFLWGDEPHYVPEGYKFASPPLAAGWHLWRNGDVHNRIPSFKMFYKHKRYTVDFTDEQSKHHFTVYASVMKAIESEFLVVFPDHEVADAGALYDDESSFKQVAVAFLKHPEIYGDTKSDLFYENKLTSVKVSTLHNKMFSKKAAGAAAVVEPSR